MKKTKIMCNNQVFGRQVMIANEPLEIEEEYIHLAQTVNANPAHEKEIRRGMRWSAFGQHCLTMNSSLPLSLKRKVYNQSILSVLTYGSETWRLTKDFERKRRSLQRGMERKMLHITWKDKENSITDQGTDKG